ncbi:MAG: SLC13 family permease [Prevotella sp.]|nr:SLC13 family permease [Prevotella sp.]
MTITLIILAATIVMFVTGRVRSDIVALCALTMLILFGILTPTEALAGFSSPVVIMMVGLFVVGGAILQTGLAKAASQRIMKLAAGSDTKLFLLVVVVTAVIGAFVSNTGTVALMMPIVVSMAAQAGMRPGRLLMPLAFASSMGGMLTLIGTPPNLVIQEALTDAGYRPLSFFSFFPVGIICIAVGIIVMLPLSRMFLYRKDGKDKSESGKSKTLEELAKEYRLENGLRRYRIRPSSAVKGKTVAELNLRRLYGLSIIEIRSESTDRSGLIRNVRQSLAGPDSILNEGDILYLTGDTEVMERFARENNLKRLDHNSIDFYDIGIAEIVLMPTARLSGCRLKSSGFREKYDINVLGIKRGDSYIQDDLPEVKMLSGDVLLVQGKWSNIAKLDDDETDWVVLGQPEKQASQVILNYRAPLAAAIMLVMIGMMVFDFIPVAPVTAVMMAGLLMVLGGCFRNVEAAYKTINWESIVLIAAMMPMSVALEKTGTSAVISHSLVSVLGSMSPTVLLAGIYFTTSLLTMFISNTATAVLMAPIAMSSAMEIGVSPYPMLFAVTLGASMCFASPFSTPPNALVMHAGEYTFGDYVKVGLPLQLIMGIVMTFVLPLLFPF